MNQALHKILIVEDEPDIVAIATFALEKLNHYTVVACSSGQEALQKLESFKPDLILMDMMMPGMDGVETLRNIRKNLNYQSIPVIFMTAKVQTEEVANYYKQGVIDVISKPFDPITLPDRLRVVWEQYIHKTGEE